MDVRKDCGPPVKTFTVDAAPGGKAKDYRFNVGNVGPSLPMPEYVKKVYRFTATASSTTLTFASTTPKGEHGFGAVLDDITACAMKPKPPAPPKHPTHNPKVPVQIHAGGGPVSGGPLSGGDPTVPLVGLVALAAVAGTGFVVIRRRRTREQR